MREGLGSGQVSQARGQLSAVLDALPVREPEDGAAWQTELLPLVWLVWVPRIRTSTSTTGPGLHWEAGSEHRGALVFCLHFPTAAEVPKAVLLPAHLCQCVALSVGLSP